MNEIVEQIYLGQFLCKFWDGTGKILTFFPIHSGIFQTFTDQVVYEVHQ